ncbi:MAG TPA: hypothetical protein VG755_44545 [Nannocystaceae bacterium]|nr:hypothetical protein [Nannocystaceae bacterium]
MGLFSSAKNCDWCGSEYEGDAIEADGLALCSQACLDLKNAPPRSAPTAEPAAPRVLTHAIATSELSIAIAELELYERLGEEADTREDDDEGDFMRGQEAYIGLWRNLATVREYLDSRVEDLREFDEEHRHWLTTADSFRTITTRNYRGHREEIGVAFFQPENANRARRAIAALQRALLDASD